MKPSTLAQSGTAFLLAAALLTTVAGFGFTGSGCTGSCASREYGETCAEANGSGSGSDCGGTFGCGCKEVEGNKRACSCRT